MSQGWEDHMLSEMSNIIALYIGTENGNIVSGEKVNKAETRYFNDTEIRSHWSAMLERMRDTFDEA